MNDGSRTVGLVFQAVARARREAVLQALGAHGMEELEARAVPWLLDGTGDAPAEEGERLLRVCWVVDEGMMADFSQEERALLGALLGRMLRTFRSSEGLLG